MCNIELIREADANARKGKHNYGIKKHDVHAEEDNQKLLEDFKNGTYKTSPYQTFNIWEPKPRTIYRLPYYPDRIAHWAIMLVMEPIWVKSFIPTTYACIKGRGIHKLVKDLKKVLRHNPEETKYCLKLDIKKFYPSINHDILKEIIRRKIKDPKMLHLLDGIIDSTSGVPIGNYLSQFFANLYLTYFDHWLKEEIGIKYYYRYADDIVVLSENKEYLRKILILIKMYLRQVLKLEVKSNYQVFEIEERGLDFVGYVFRHNYIKLRKSIKLNLFKTIHKYKRGKLNDFELDKRLASYGGWSKYCNSKHLLQKVETITKVHLSNWWGTQSNISNFYNKPINLVEISPHRKYYQLHFTHNKKPRAVNSKSKLLYRELTQCKLPLNIKIKGNART